MKSLFLCVHIIFESELHYLHSYWYTGLFDEVPQWRISIFVWIYDTQNIMQYIEKNTRKYPSPPSPKLQIKNALVFETKRLSVLSETSRRFFKRPWSFFCRNILFGLVQFFGKEALFQEVRNFIREVHCKRLIYKKSELPEVLSWKCFCDTIICPFRNIHVFL